MTLDDLFLEKLADWRPDSGRKTLTVAGEDGWRVALTADHNDQVGTRAWELTVSREAPVPDLRGWADRVAARVTGLLEPLKLLELDATQDTAVLRSQAPTPRASGLHYYEVLLRGSGEAAVRRYEAVRDGSKHREQIGFALTHEALAKLSGDIAGAV